jgi:hypothetical protein
MGIPGVSSRFKRRIAAVAAVALLLSSTLFLAHGYGDGARAHDEAQCQLCHQFGGAGGAPSSPSPRVLLASALLFLILPVVQFVPARRTVDSRLPRGPPTL